MSIEQQVEDLGKRLVAVESALRTLAQTLQDRWSEAPLPTAHPVAAAEHLPGKGAAREIPVAPWQHLVARPHPWRRQLYIKGRNMTVRQLLGTIKANKQPLEEAARNLDLPVEALSEAVEYAEKNKELLDYETAYERLLLAQKGQRLGPPPVSR